MDTVSPYTKLFSCLELTKVDRFMHAKQHNPHMGHWSVQRAVKTTHCVRTLDVFIAAC